MHIILSTALISGYRLGMVRVSSYQELKTGYLQQSQNLLILYYRNMIIVHSNFLIFVVSVADDKLRIGPFTFLYRFGSNLDKYF